MIAKVVNVQEGATRAYPPQQFMFPSWPYSQTGHLPLTNERLRGYIFVSFRQLHCKGHDTTRRNGTSVDRDLLFLCFVVLDHSDSVLWQPDYIGCSCGGGLPPTRTSSTLVEYHSCAKYYQGKNCNASYHSNLCPCQPWKNHKHSVAVWFNISTNCEKKIFISTIILVSDKRGWREESSSLYWPNSWAYPTKLFLDHCKVWKSCAYTCLCLLHKTRSRIPPATQAKHSLRWIISRGGLIQGINSVTVSDKYVNVHFVGFIKLIPRPCPHYTGAIWKRRVVPAVRSTVHTNPSRKRRFVNAIQAGGIWKRWLFVLV